MHPTTFQMFTLEQIESTRSHRVYQQQILEFNPLTVFFGVMDGLVRAKHGERVIGQCKRVDDGTLQREKKRVNLLHTPL